MKKLYAVLGLILVSIPVCAQSANTTEVASARIGEANSAPKAAGAKKPGIEIPPEKANPVTVPKMGLPIVIDGKPDEEAWKDAAVFKDFYQTAPGDNVAPSKPTEVRMMYDEKYLYVSFKCWDEKDKIRATVAKRDEVFGEDNVRMWLDTYNDRRRAYVFGFNPFGVQQDGIYTEGQGADFSVDIVMESKGVIEDWGWSVEVKIPFKSLRYTAGKGKLWGFNVARNIDRFNDEFDQWLPDDRNISGFLIKHGKITGLDGIKYERTLEIVPSVTISETGSRKRTVPNAGFAQLGPYDPIFNPIGIQDPGRFVNDGVKHDIGVNLKYTLSPNVTFDAAINPDFAEIEADAPVVSANQRFPIFFQEKRPFFLEGKDIFDSPLQPFYSRTIVDPDFAAKLTGKVGKNTFGFLAASDNAPGNYSEDERGELFVCQNLRQGDIDGGRPPRQCGIEEFVDKNAFFSVLRVKHDIGAENNVGFFATARMFPKNRNFTGGFDGKFKLDPKTVMTFQVLGTHSRKFFYDPETDENKYRTGNGFGYYWSLDYTKDLRGWFAEAVGRTSDYRADAGFTRRNNSNTYFFANRLSTKSKPKATIIRADWQQFLRYGFDWKGRRQQALLANALNLALQGNVFMNIEAGLQWEDIYEDEFGPKRNSATGQSGGFAGAPSRSTREPYFSVNINKNVSKRLFIYGFVGSIFNAFDYDFGGGSRYPRASPAFQAYLSSPEYAQYISQLYLYQADPTTVPYPDFPSPPALDPGRGWQFDLNAGAEYKPIDPLRLSIDYTKSSLKRNDTGDFAFDTNIFTLRSTYQFTRFTFVRARWDYDTLQANASGQFLFGWNPNPGTAFYVGYNDNFNYKGFSPFTGQPESGFERNSRTFFIRASYLFRKSF
ncbi:MAG TPA: DUF5916 domain-containing protein [Pyrinomonadaceae bacterium]|nr:DUF5916 domain-containing protein [Pyrinomonadaceae bacterium]